jgi:hypothetical protein
MSIYTIIFCGGIRVWTQCFTLARQALYNLSHTSSLYLYNFITCVAFCNHTILKIPNYIITFYSYFITAIPNSSITNLIIPIIFHELYIVIHKNINI